MTERKWTEGPWVALPYDDIGDEVAIHKFDGEYVASVDCDGCFDVLSGPVITANAHLIAAAPDLYEALEGIITAMEGIGHGPFEAERAALAKARGESK